MATGPLEVTVSVAEVVLLGPARADVIEKLVVKVPRFEPVTARLTVQEAPPGSGGAPAKFRLLPSAACDWTLNWQVVGGTVEKVKGKSRPGGRVTGKVGKTRAKEGLGLVKVSVKVEFVVCRMVEGLKELATR